MTKPNEKISIPHHAGDYFIFGSQNEQRFDLKTFWAPHEEIYEGEIIFGNQCQGPPGHAHGGSIAALLDEMMGGAAWLSGFPVLAGTLTIHYKKIIPLNQQFRIKAWVIKIDGKKILTKSELISETNDIHTIGEGLFIEVDKSVFSKEARKASINRGPAANWRKFAKERI